MKPLIKTRDILEKYGLQLESKKPLRYRVSAREGKMRLLLSKETLFSPHVTALNNGSTIHSVSKVVDRLTGLLIKYEYRISDVFFQNLIMHVLLIINRMKNSNFTKEINMPLEDDIRLHKEFQLSKEIIRTFFQNYDNYPNKMKMESANLAFYLLENQNMIVVLTFLKG